MSSVKVTVSTILCCVLVFAKEPPPNVVFIMFDDLSMSEVSYNGGLINTTVLDAYAETGIRLNYHYSEQVCSPSRAAFMTGRYSWKSGLNSLSGLRKNAHFDPSAVLFSQLLNQAGCNVDIAGKWHIGYKYDDILPYKRGFKTGLYGHVGTGYYGNDMNTKFNKTDAYFPITKKKLRQRRKCVFPNRRLPTFDLFKVVNNGDGTYSEEATQIGHSSYVDDLYAEHTRSFIANQTANTSFVTVLNLYTPHSDTESPPNNLPATLGNTSLVDHYSAICGRDIIESTNKTMICKQLLYAEALIEGIVAELKSKDLYTNTILIIASDNGGASTVESGTEYAETMPLRGRKSGPFEGGTRSAVIVTGGWIENYVLGQNITAGCDYNHLMHISDWYHVFMNLYNITSSNTSPLLYAPDSDHSTLQIWDDIRCECGSNRISGVDQCEGSTESNPFTQRTEMIQLQTCSTKQHPNKTGFLTVLSNATEFFSAYIRKTITNETTGADTEYKLVIGGSSELLEDCPYVAKTAFNILSTYSERTGAFHDTPDWVYYNQFYLPFNAKYPSLYKSNCLERIVEEDPSALNTTNRTEFLYSNSLLYEIADDTVEACDVSLSHPTVVTALKEALRNASTGYLVSDWNADPSIGAFYAQVDSYQCKDHITMLVPWEGNNETMCNKNATGIEDCDEVWSVLIRKAEKCCDRNPDLDHCFRYYNDSTCGGYNSSDSSSGSDSDSGSDSAGELEIPIAPMRPRNNHHELWFQTVFSSWNIAMVSSLLFITVFSVLLVFCEIDRRKKAYNYAEVEESMSDDDEIFIESDL